MLTFEGMKGFILQDLLNDVARNSTRTAAKVVLYDAYSVAALLADVEMPARRLVDCNQEWTASNPPPPECRWYDYRGKIVGGCTMLIVGIIGCVLTCRIWKEERAKRERRRLEDKAEEERIKAEAEEAKKDQEELDQLKARLQKLKVEAEQIKQMSPVGWGCVQPGSARSFTPKAEVELPHYFNSATTNGHGDMTQPFSNSATGHFAGSATYPVSGGVHAPPGSLGLSHSPGSGYAHHSPHLSHGPPQPQAWPQRGVVTDPYGSSQAQTSGFGLSHAVSSPALPTYGGHTQNYGGHTASTGYQQHQQWNQGQQWHGTGY